MRVNRGLLGWGVFFIVLGVVPIAVRGGWLGEDIVVRAWRLWPLILIGIGMGLVLRRTRAAILGSLVVAVTAGVMFGSLLATGIEGIGNGGFTTCGIGVGDNGRIPFPDQRGTLGDNARVQVQLDCGEARVTTTSGSDWTLAGTSRTGTPPDIASGADRLSITSSETSGPAIGPGSPKGVEWDVTLPQAPRTSLDLGVNAGSITANLDSVALDGVQASVNAGSATIDLSRATSVGRLEGSVNAGSLSVSVPATDVTGDLSANAGSIELCVPDGVDIRLRVTDNTLGSTNFDQRGMTRSGDTWQTPGFGSGTAQVDLSVSVNLGSISLNPENGCE